MRDEAMIVSVHQPDYFPYLGYFYKIYKSDLFVFLDDAQFSKLSGISHNRNKIRKDDTFQYITVPVKYKFGDSINKVVTIDELYWKNKHLAYFRQNYKEAKFFNDVYQIIEQLLLREYNNFSDMNTTIIIELCRRMGIDRQFARSSELEIFTSRQQRVIDIVKKVHGDTYYSGNGARVYQNCSDFIAHEIQLIYSDYTPIIYPQVGTGFISNLSIVDYIFNCGFRSPFTETQ